MYPRSLIRFLLAIFASCVVIGAPAMACTVTATVGTNLGTYSPAAVNAGAVPALKSAAGLTCVPSVIVVLGGNYINAKFHSQNGLKLLPASGSAAIAYTASADSGGTVPFTQDGTVNYMQNNLLNVLGLLSGSSANFPLYVKPSGGAVPPNGTYTDKITVTWNWYLCQGVNALFVCLGTPDSGTATTTVNVTLTVTTVSMTLSTSSVTTWDPLNGTTNPKAIPTSLRRTIVTVTNPDIVAIDNNAVSIVVPVASGETVALNGDGTGATITFTDGSPASNLTLTYASPGSSTDDVDFSSDNGTTWTYVPVAGDAASQAVVNAIRLRPKGVMAAGSTFSVALPFSIN